MRFSSLSDPSQMSVFKRCFIWQLMAIECTFRAKFCKSNVMDCPISSYSVTLEHLKTREKIDIIFFWNSSSHWRRWPCVPKWARVRNRLHWCEWRLRNRYIQSEQVLYLTQLSIYLRKYPGTSSPFSIQTRRNTFVCSYVANASKNAERRDKTTNLTIPLPMCASNSAITAAPWGPWKKSNN